jgi:hypothetical protein
LDVPSKGVFANLKKTCAMGSLGTVARLGLVVGVTGVWPLIGQTVVDVPDRAKFDEIFDGFNGDRLKCNARAIDPFIDFGFRFILPYGAECEIRQFGGVASRLKTYLRVRREDGTQMVFGDKFLIPAAPKGFDLTKLRGVHNEIELSGAVAAGVGAYDMELLMVDNHNRIYRKHWRAKALPRGRERDVNFSLRPGSLMEMAPSPLPSKSGARRDARITVLLNAAPVNPWSRKLRAWDRAFLLNSLSSLLRQLSYSSVRVIAFNLEQQKEVFREDDFGERDVSKLNEALRSLELGKIEYATLQRREGWAELLLRLLKEETHADQPSQALVFLGPSLRLVEKAPPEMLVGYQPSELPLFCVTYYPHVGSDFPDSLQDLTKALKGRVFRIHSPSELAQNLEKLQRAIEGDGTAKTARTSP